VLAVFAVLGLVAGALAGTFFSVPAHSLPSFLAHLPGVGSHRKRYVEISAAIAMFFLVLAILDLLTRRLSAEISDAWRRFIGR
jgi:hypothetical protein